MIINNKRIIHFFDQHKNLDPENTILHFIDIMETLHEKMNHSMNNSVVFDILDKLKQIDTKVENVSQNIKENKNIFTIKISEIKTDYISQLKTLLTCNTTENITPMFLQQNEILFNKINNTIEKIIPKNHTDLSDNIKSIISQFQQNIVNDTKQLLNSNLDKSCFEINIQNLDKKISESILLTQSNINQTMDSSQQRLENKIDKIRDISNNNDRTTIQLNDSVNTLLKKFENSSIKGKMSENLIQNIIQELYPCANINNVGTTKETGDIIIERVDKPKILIENKSWNRNIVQSEVIKFIRDIETQDCSGIFLSQNTKITTKNNFEINIHNNNVLVYIHEVSNDPDKIKLAIDIIDNLKIKIDDVLQGKDSSTDTISKEIVEYINIEYQNFITQKTSLIKITKDFNKRILKQIDELKLPSLEDYLSRKYSFSSNKYVCEYCNFVGKNQQSKSAHLRGCVERKKKLNIIT